MEHIIKGNGQDSFITDNESGAEFIRELLNSENYGKSHLKNLYSELDEDAKAAVKNYLKWNEVYYENLDGCYYALRDAIEETYRMDNLGFDSFEDYLDFFFYEVTPEEFENN